MADEQQGAFDGLCPMCAAERVIGPDLTLWFMADGRILLQAGRQSNAKDPRWLEMTLTSALWFMAEVSRRQGHVA